MELGDFWARKAGQTERQAVLDWAAASVVGRVGDAKVKRCARSRQLLLSYQGDLGKYLKAGATASMHVDDVVAVVRASTFFFVVVSVQ